MRNLMVVLALIFVSLIPTPVTAGTVRIRNDLGGDVESYNARFERYARAGTRVVIDGDCVSACARFMSLRTACATPRGRFFMHGLTRSGRLNVEAGVRDSETWELPAAVALQSRYDAFGFWYEPHRGPRVVPVEPGVAIVYAGPDLPGKGFQKFLRVDAARLIPACSRR